MIVVTSILIFGVVSFILARFPAFFIVSFFACVGLTLVGGAAALLYAAYLLLLT